MKRVFFIAMLLCSTTCAESQISLEEPLFREQNFFIGSDLSINIYSEKDFIEVEDSIPYHVAVYEDVVIYTSYDPSSSDWHEGHTQIQQWIYHGDELVDTSVEAYLTEDNCLFHEYGWGTVYTDSDGWQQFDLGHL